MLGPQKVKMLLQQILHASESDQIEAVILAQETLLTRFANNAIHQHVAETNAVVMVRAVVGGRTGLASTNDLRPAALDQVAAQAAAHARQQVEDPLFPGLPELRPITPVQALDAATADCTPETRARIVGSICALARAEQCIAAGALRTVVREVAIGNSLGLFAYHPGTIADLQLVAMSADGSGWSQGSSWKIADIEPERLGREAVAKAVRAQQPRTIPPGEYAIVVDPYVTDELLTTLSVCGMGANTVQEGRSWMNDRIGQQVLSPLISIWDDGHDPAGAPLPFDFEGMPRRRVQLVERGTILGPVYDRYTARREDKETTGHAMLPDPLLGTGPLARNLFMAGGDSSVEEMIATTERGLYITRFWYPRLVHPRDCTITAMTRDGVFMIEDGELAYPVKNLRFTQSYVTALANVEAVGREVHTFIDDSGGASRVPALKIAGFHFTGSTV